MESRRTPRRPSFDFGSARSSTGTPAYNRRFVARIIDGFAAVVPAVLLIALLPGFAGRFLGMLAAAAYILFSDGLDARFMRQRSLGKHLMGLRPERLDGAAMTPETSARRNWPLVVGYLGVVPVIGWLFSLAGLALVVYECYKVFADTQGRRWGDTLASTRVVEVRASRRRS